jgi:hypothetical protein
MDEGHAEALRIVREYGDPADVEQLDRIRGNAMGPSIYHSVMMGALARAFEEHVKPQPRGRPKGS